MIEPLEKRSRPESTESAVASMTPSNVTCLLTFCFGSSCTVIIFSCSPHMATFATPSTRMRRARIVQYAIIDIAMTDWSFEVIPIFMTRAVAEPAASSPVARPRSAGSASQSPAAPDELPSALQIRALLEDHLNGRQLRN